VTDSLPAIALGMEPVEKDVMRRKPRAKDESIFAHGVGLKSALQGLLIGALTIIAYFIGSRVFTLDGNTNIPLGETMAFATLAISQLVHAFNIRSSHSLFRIGFHTNKYMVGAFFASLLLMLIVLLLPPLQSVFNVTTMTAGQWGIVAALTLVPFVIVELSKLFDLIFNKTK